ncbi:hypothetical protein G9A89_015717 [Geosiphon pyriformis]|nr:hypothetical protein G9A89_015717 [Geosiphon pyriformis]
MLLVLLNFCLVGKSVPGPWREAWVSMIPKPYEWKRVLTNICPIALIETAHKILSKILSDRISSACSTFDVLCGNNFLVLKGMIMQSPIFAIGSVVEDALKKNREVWSGSKCVAGLLDFLAVFTIVALIGQETGELTSFFTAGAFVDDTVWVGSSQAVTQHILDVASEFFRFNDISVNNDKTVAIPINCRIMDSHLIISGAPISIAKKGESHRYLGVFLSSESFSKLSLAKAQANVRFFVNLVLRKAISDKQCTYLVSAVLFPIISYRTQFSFVSIGVCSKWDALVCKILKSKSGLPRDFPSNALHYPSLYNLKTFEQIQTKNKLASVIAFANSTGVLSYLFSHRSHDLQVLSWCFRHPLLFLARVGISPSNNFLAGVYSYVFGSCESCFFKCISLLRHYGIAFVEQLRDRNGNVFSWGTFKHWKRLDPRSPVPFWFDLSIRFLGGVVPLFSSFFLVNGHAVFNICLSYNFGVVHDTLPTVDAPCLSVYMDGSLSGLGTVDVRAGAAIFFEDINLGLGVGVSGLVFSTLMELQAIALVLECVLFSHLIDLFLDSQAALDAYVSDNKHADALAKDAVFSAWRLSHLVSERFLCAGDMAVSGNSRHFVRDVFQSVHRARWEVGVSSRVVDDSLRADINWSKSFMVWYTDSHLAFGFTSMCTAGCHTYFIKALHHWFSVAVHKRLYDRRYPSVVCLFCGDVETSDHIFLCPQDAVDHAHLLGAHVSAWEALSGLSCSSSCVL